MDNKTFDTLEQSIELYKRGLQPNTEFVYVWNYKETKLKHFDIKGDTVSQLKSLYDDNALIKVAEEDHFLHEDFTQTICPAYAKGTFDEDGPYARVYSIGWYKLENFEIESADFDNYRYMIYSHADMDGVVVAGGMTEERHTTYLFGLFVIPRTRKVTKVLVEMKDGENTERFLRKPSECFKVIDEGSSDA